MYKFYEAVRVMSYVYEYVYKHVFKYRNHTVPGMPLYWWRGAITRVHGLTKSTLNKYFQVWNLHP